MRLKNRLVALKKEWSYGALVIPALSIYALFFLYPFLHTIVYGFTDWADIRPTGVHFVGLRNFVTVVTDEVYRAGIQNTLVYAFATTIAINALAIPLAVALNRKLLMKNALRAVFFMPAVLSPLIIGFLWSFLYSTSDFGLFNQLLQKLGFGKVNFLGDPDLALYAVIFTQVWQWLGYNTIIYLANLQTLSREYFEAAQIDGASSLQSFRYITVPLLTPAITFCTVTSMISGLKVFDIVYALTSGGPGHATETIVSLMVKRGVSEGFYGEGAAFGTVFVMIVGLITLLQLRLIRRWEGR